MTHRSALALLLLTTFLWSTAGVVSRWLHGTPGFEMVFWRSTVAACAVSIWLFASLGPSVVTRIRHAGAAIWLSALCWAVMFTCFMISLTLTKVANVLIVQSLAPLFTAFLVRLVFRRKLAQRTWLAMTIAAAGVAVMYIGDIDDLSARSTLGMLLALCIPIASALNLVVLQRAGHVVDLRAAVALGAAISALAIFPFAVPLKADPHDIAWLAVLGMFQLSLPCVLLVIAARALPAHELALLALLEVPFGVAWTWLFGDESPGALALLGGITVIAVLVVHEWLTPNNAKSD